jgi:multidrug efflux pump
VQLSPTGNAMATATAVQGAHGRAARYFPEGVKFRHALRHVQVRAAVDQEVVKTLLEAIGLVFLVMYLFLQNFRYTLIPTVVVPVALLGTFG